MTEVVGNLHVKIETDIARADMLVLVVFTAWFMGIFHWRSEEAIHILVKHSPKNRTTGFVPEVAGDTAIVELARRPKLPQYGKDPRFRADMLYQMDTVEECLVATLAHELAHLRGMTGQKDGEFFCELAARAALTAYRDYFRTVQSAIDDVSRSGSKATIFRSLFARVKHCAKLR